MRNFLYNLQIYFEKFLVIIFGIVIGILLIIYISFLLLYLSLFITSFIWVPLLIILSLSFF